MTFGALETGLKFDDCRWLSGGLPELRGHGRLRVISSSLGLITVTKQYGVDLQHVKYSLKPAGIKGYEKTSMQTARIRKIKAAILSHSHRGTRIQDSGHASQPDGPSTDGPADYP